MTTATTNNKPSAFLTRREATLNHLVKQVASLDLESLTALGAVLLDVVDARAEAARPKRYEVHEHFHPQEIILRTDDLDAAWEACDARPGRWVIDTVTRYYADRQLEAMAEAWELREAQER